MEHEGANQEEGVESRGTGRIKAGVIVRGSKRSRAVWGVLLILAGTYFLLRQLDLIEGLHGLRTWWPAILMAIGVASMVAAESPRKIASGLSMVLLGLWFFACIQHWYDLTYRTGWPILLVIFGFEMVLSAVLERLGPAKEETHA